MSDHIHIGTDPELIRIIEPPVFTRVTATSPPELIVLRRETETTKVVVNQGIQGPGISEAPMDGNTYARKDGAWVQI